MQKRVFLSIMLLVLGGWPAGQPAPSGISFEDVSGRSGLRLERRASAEKRYLIETMGGGVAWFDYDGDGWLDAYLCNQPTVESFRAGVRPANRLYRNNRDGTFLDVTEKAGVGFRGWSMGVSAADYDNDGDVDLYLTNLGANVLYRNETKPGGEAAFVDVTASAGVGDARWSASSGWSDYDGDGDLDLFVANYVEYDLKALPEFGRGRYCLFRSLEVLCGPRGMRGAGDALYRNNGDGTFAEISREAGVADEAGHFGLGCAWGDFDDDGDQDLFVTNDTQANYLYLNQGGGRFKEAGLLSGAALDANGKARAGMGIAVGDYDRDGRLDLGVTNFSDEAYALFRNEGGGMFADRAGAAGIARTTMAYLGWAMFFADFDNDGWPDLFAANGHVYPQVDRIDLGTKYRQRALVFRNTGKGGFTDVSAEAGLQAPRAHRGGALGDYDRDGDLDLLLMDLDGQPVLLENRSASSGHWLRVRAAVGTRITLEAGGATWTDEVRASGSYQSGSEPVAHFGLGAVATIDRLTARFTTGRTEILRAVKADQLLTIKNEVR